jgi:hypothetical protein
MSKFKNITVDTINKTYLFESNSGNIFITGESGFEAVNFFSSKNHDDRYTEDEIVFMVNILTAFQYYWLNKRTNFSDYGCKHHAVQQYIFDYFPELLLKTRSSVLTDMYEVFK